MKYLFVSSNLPAKERSLLTRFGTVISLPPLPSLPYQISHHPDTLTAKIGDKLFIYSDYSAGAELLDSLGIPFEKIAQSAGNTYPLDTALNCFRIGNTLFCRKKSIAPEILGYASSLGLGIADTNQGYAHCTAAVFSDSIITSDKCVADAAVRFGIGVLTISDGGISLPGYNCGFIGGTCAEVDGHAVFFGDPRTHPDGEKLLGFVSAKKLVPFPLSDGKLTDFGGILIITA